ncbi:guanine nucleotide exchange factor DBS-like [Anomaloglossus baeobatrachus]|uniref:guanine nucleotide exchange factor DBS-like n=1 Tax=Anomaloglossus baeobatrachus TaxID=238106 RepID=UPI003F5057B7
MASVDTVRISEVEMEKYYSLQQAASLLYTLLEKSAAPICAKDIADQLMKEFAFLSGGRGKDNGWIITLPENATFHEVPEDVLKTVLTYLTSVPGYAL